MNTKHKKGESFNVTIKQVRKVTPKHLSDFIKFPQNMKMIVHVARYTGNMYLFDNIWSSKFKISIVEMHWMSDESI